MMLPRKVYLAINRAMAEQPLHEDPIAKARKGEQAADHKYLSRKPDGKGGYDYTYAPKDGEHAQLDLFATPVKEIQPKFETGRKVYQSTVEHDPRKPWTAPDWTPDLANYDYIAVNSSAGKDSQAMLHRVVQLCDARGIPRSKIIVVHADLGQVEWEGTRDLAKAQAAHYGLRFEAVVRPQGDLLAHIEGRYAVMRQREIDVQALARAGVRTWGALAALDQDAVEAAIGPVSPDWPTAPAARDRAIQLRKSARAKPADEKIDFGAAVPWPSSAARYCTSDHKTSQVQKLFVQLGQEAGRPVKILSTLGIRAQESPARAKKPGFRSKDSASTQSRQVDEWYPIFGWPEEQVWDTIAESKVPHHQAYDHGMRRLSCVFCVFAPKADLAIAAEHNPELFQRYLALEQKVGASFSDAFSLADVAKLVRARRAAGDVPVSALTLGKRLAKAFGGTIDLGPLAATLLEAITPDVVGVAVDWKDGGVCVHVDTTDDSRHIAWLQGEYQAPGALLAATMAGAAGLEISEHGTPPPGGVPLRW